MGAVELMTIGEVAARSGVAVSALRYYEAQGLVHCTRTPGGARRFPRSVLRRLAFVRAAQNVGLSLPEIRAALDTLPEGRTPSAQDWAQLSEAWRDRLDEQIAALERLRDGLSSCIGCGCLSLSRCALSNPGDVAGAAGPGARWLPPALRRVPPTSNAGSGALGRPAASRGEGSGEGRRARGEAP
ncbi:redox-sensitive transcriptional activator SoxR [Blastococcus sp. SYSU D00820]